MRSVAMRWTIPNLLIYRAGHRLLRLRRWTGARIGRRAPAAAPRSDAPLLYLANGRLGDALLASAFTSRYRSWFGPVVAVGRPETAAIVAGHVDRFVAFDPVRDGTAPAELAGTACRAVLGDLHLFHGGDALLDLAAATGAPVIAYDGWIDRGRQAPFRRWPNGATIVPALGKVGAAPGDAERLHAFFDLAHYHRQALRLLGAASTILPEAPELPAEWTAPGDGPPLALPLPAGFVACHASSSQPKKDWPIDRFDALFAARPDLPFVLLGTDAAPLPHRDHVLDLRRRTDVRQAIAVATRARAFVGVDSGLAHAAALGGVPTVVVMPQATPGYFFPYPQAFGRQVQVVRSAAHATCSGCGGICALEPLWRSRRHGFPCLRAVAVADVAAALQRALTDERCEPGRP